MAAINNEQKPWVIGASVVLILGALAYMVHKVRQPTTVLEVNAAVERIIGEAAATEVIQLISDRGTVALIGLDPSGRFKRASQIQDGFLLALKKHPNIKVVATEMIPPSEVMKMGTRSFGVPVAVFTRLLETQPKLDAIVSFAGVPKLAPAEMRNSADNLPKFVAVYAMGFDGIWEKRLLQEGLVQAAIVCNPSPVPDVGNRRRTPEEWYHVFYTVARPETADLIPN